MADADTQWPVLSRELQSYLKQCSRSLIPSNDRRDAGTHLPSCFKALQGSTLPSKGIFGHPGKRKDTPVFSSSTTPEALFLAAS